MSGTTLGLLVDLCARLHLATEAIGDGHSVTPDDVRLDDVDPFEQRRLRALGRTHLWSLINESNAQAKISSPTPPPEGSL